VRFPPVHVWERELQGQELTSGCSGRGGASHCLSQAEELYTGGESNTPYLKKWEGIRLSEVSPSTASDIEI